MTYAEAIVQDVLAQLRGAGPFSQVEHGADRGTSLPRATVELLGEQSRRADDAPARWHRLRLEICITTSGQSQAAAVERALELAELARAALLADRFRGGHAADLPWGAATEFVNLSLAPSVKPPLCQVRLEVQCHYEIPGDD